MYTCMDAIHTYTHTKFHSSLSKKAQTPSRGLKSMRNLIQDKEKKITESIEDKNKI